MGDAVKIVFGGRNWYYQSFFDESGKTEAIRLYGNDGEFLKEFYSEDDMTDYIIETVNRGQKEAKEKIQKSFMKKMAVLQGNMSDAEFSGYLGMSYPTLYQYLSGRRFPSVYALVQIADKCYVTIDWLVGRGEE